MKKVFLAGLLALVCGLDVSAQAGAVNDKLAGSPVFDRGFQDMVETAHGYLNPAFAPVRKFRDAVAAPAADRSGYVFVSILPRAADYSGLLKELSASAGFVLTGERVSRKGAVKRVRVLGWVKADSLQSVRLNPGVVRLKVVNKPAL